MILANVIESAFHPLIWLFEQILVGVHSVVGGSWGWAIIGLTLIVRAAMFPLTRSQFKSAAVMRAHKPELDRIKARYKDDRVRQQEEMMKYFKEVGYNPLAACLPLVLQLPIFISLVYMLRADLKQRICETAVKGVANLASIQCKLVAKTVHGATQLQAQKAADNVVSHHASFLFVHDITAKATGSVLIVLIVLYVGTQLIASLITAISADPTQRRIMLALPFVFVLFVINFPAGLIVYWITTNVWTIGQQLLVRKLYPKPEPLDPRDAVPETKPSRGKPTTATASAVASDGGGNGSGKGKGKAAVTAGAGDGGPAKAPPKSPRKKKKRSGRRR